MPLPLPNLDTRRWTDLVDDGRSLIPRYSPAWTDYNAHDPGITLLELFAWIAEMDVYRTNRVPPRHVLKFLALMEFVLNPPVAASVPLSLTGSGLIPAGSRFTTASGIGFRTLRDLAITPAALAALQVDAGDGTVRDQTSKLGTGTSIEMFGHEPVPGSITYLGFSQLPEAPAQTLYFWVAEPGGGIAAFAWEAFVGGAQPWTALTVNRDDTLSLTQSGEVELTIPDGLVKTALGEVGTQLFYLRCRLVNASYDATPLLARVAPNTTLAEQAVPAFATYTIASTAAIAGPIPAAGAAICLDCTMDTHGVILSLNFLAPNTAGHPAVRVLKYIAPTLAAPGSLTIDLELVTSSMLLPGAPVQQDSLHVFTHQNGNWQEWTRRNDLDSSTRTDFHFTADPTSGAVVFGDGERGRTVPTGALVFAQYRTTLADGGNLAASLVIKSSLAGVAVTNLSPAQGGAAAEDLEGATSRAAAVLYCHDSRSPDAPANAVDIEDYERIALRVPHTRVARTKAYAGLDARYPCLQAPGSVTVVVIPAMRIPRPMPSAHLLQTVQAYLDRRRTVCTQVHVTGPTYVEVTVTASVALVADANPATVQPAIVTALDTFLDPLVGGPSGDGWPFGRDVYRTEIMQLIAGVSGVDHVTSLSLAANGVPGSCGNLSICAGALVSSGAHQITTTTEASS
jgi:hypothetical protein